MRKAVVALIIAVALLPMISTIAVAETRIMDQRTSYCGSGEAISGEVEQGERVEVSMSILVSEEKELSLFSSLTAPAFYLEEDKVSDNSSVLLKLQPGTHKIRVIGTVPMGADGEELTLLGSYDLGKYVTSTIRSPYILKSSADTYILITGVSCAIAAGLIVFFSTKGKLYRMKSTIVKKSEDKRKKDREKMIVFLKEIAPNLNAVQRKRAKELLKETDEV